MIADGAVVVTDSPPIKIVRDPNDHMILACAMAARADYLVSRDNDLLPLGEYDGIYRW
jgi:putative PIN family toxin of toxin-antitoxin system